MRYWLTALAMFSATSAMAQGVEFRVGNPLAVKRWEGERLQYESGKQVCRLSAYNVEILVPESGSTRVRSIRPSQVGTVFRITVEGQSFRTIGDEIPAERVPALLDAFRTHSRAYVSWVEPDGGHEKRPRYSDMLDLTGFAEAYDGCFRK